MFIIHRTFMGVYGQIRICDVTVQMPLVRGKSPKTPDIIE